MLSFGRLGEGLNRTCVKVLKIRFLKNQPILETHTIFKQPNYIIDMSEEILQFPTPPEGKKRFEVKMRPANGGGIEKAIFIDNEIMDWQIDLNSYMEAVKMGPMYRREIQRSIEEHFIESVSDTLGRKVTMEEIKVAIKTGWI